MSLDWWPPTRVGKIARSGQNGGGEGGKLGGEWEEQSRYTPGGGRSGGNGMFGTLSTLTAALTPFLSLGLHQLKSWHRSKEVHYGMEELFR